MTEVLRTLDPRDEAEVRALQGTCHRLHLMPPPVAYVGLEVYQCPKELLVAGHIPDGLKLDKIGIEPATVYNARSQSWVRNAYNTVVTQMLGLPSNTGGAYGAGGLYNKNTAGTERYSSTNCLCVNQVEYWVGALGAVTNGIVVGTGTGAESFGDYSLGALIANGTGAGQMSYTAQETTTGNYNSGAKTWAATLIRYINNNSGGAIVVGETACYVTQTGGASGTHYAMLARDLQDPTVSVADTAQLKVTYTITSMAYPA